METWPIASQPLGRALADRYLAALEARREAPSLSALRDLVSRHLRRVPFENVSKLWHRSRHGLIGLPPVEVFLDGIERYRLGGTCYPNNVHLGSLLEHLGYDVLLCGADMDAPDVHVALVVRIDEREYLVDGGYGAPFLDPLPRDVATDQVIPSGRDTYVLRRRDAQGCSRLDHLVDGVSHHGYLLKPVPRRPPYFGDVIAASFQPEAHFLNRVVVARFEPGRTVTLRNLTVTFSDARGSRVERLRDRGALLETVERLFGIPTWIVDEATAGLALDEVS